VAEDHGGVDLERLAELEEIVRPLRQVPELGLARIAAPLPPMVEED
jgi:hypothetical protein